jgi:uncharacterized OsmC-like protein
MRDRVIAFGTVERSHDVSTTSPRNGVNLDQLVQTVEAVQQNPAIAQFQFRTTSRWEGGGRSVTTISSFSGAGGEQQHERTHTLVGDEPHVLLGTDAGPNAVETVLAGLASCLAVGVAYNAAAQGIDLTALEFDVEGDLDLHAFLGLSDDVRPGFQNIRVHCRVKSEASKDQLSQLFDYVQRTSPVLDIVRNPVPVSLDLVDEA